MLCCIYSVLASMCFSRLVLSNLVLFLWKTRFYYRFRCCCCNYCWVSGGHNTHASKILFFCRITHMWVLYKCTSMISAFAIRAFARIEKWCTRIIIPNNRFFLLHSHSFILRINLRKFRQMYDLATMNFKNEFFLPKSFNRSIQKKAILIILRCSMHRYHISKKFA